MVMWITQRSANGLDPLVLKRRFSTGSAGPKHLNKSLPIKDLKNGDDPKCKLCKNNKKTVDFMISGCPTIVNTEYLQRHDGVAKYIHWIL